MSTRKQKPSDTARGRPDPNWAASGALTDEEIDAQIAADPDVAPDVSDWSLDQAVMMEPVDIAAIRAKLGMPQEEFAQAFGLNLTALRDWEQRRRMPRGTVLTLLQIIDREPAAVLRALGPSRHEKFE